MFLFSCFLFCDAITVVKTTCPISSGARGRLNLVCIRTTVESELLLIQSLLIQTSAEPELLFVWFSFDTVWNIALGQFYNL